MNAPTDRGRAVTSRACRHLNQFEPETTELQAPYPYAGGKRRVADIVWSRFGNITNYVEPFFGSGAVWWACPLDPLPIATVNDLDGFISNFWRSVKSGAIETADYADFPVIETDLVARHIWLVNRAAEIGLADRLKADPDFFDAKIAGWWVWGISAWIGGEFAKGHGCWNTDGHRLINIRDNGGKIGVSAQLPHLGDAGQGVYAQLPHLGDAGRGECARTTANLREWFTALADRLRRVRVCCGSWQRICDSPSTLFHAGPCGVFADPPYASADRCAGIYAHDSLTVARDVETWARKWGDNPQARIAICGYEGDYPNLPDTWERFEWKAAGGYGRQSKDGNDNGAKERIYFSPHCVRPVAEPTLFDE